jgi:gamma-glutamyltranspeptidase/glutathione hydrolase
MNSFVTKPWHLLLALLVWQGSAHAQQYAVSSAHPLATQAGIQMLDQGGNAFDAAVAVSAALAVVEPTGSGLGGGGFWLYYDQKERKSVFLDGREVAPLSATPDMYVRDGKAVPSLSRDGVTGVAIPGSPAALLALSQKGRLPLAQQLSAAIGYAQTGFVVDEKLASAIEKQQHRFNRVAGERFVPNGLPLKAGERLVQPELAQVLNDLPRFYNGNTGKRLLQMVNRDGGAWVEADLSGYQVTFREPLRGQFRGYQITTAPPPSAGGVAILSVLQQLEVLNWQSDRPEARHQLIEAMRRAYRDRNQYLADPDFVKVPTSRLISRERAEQWAASIQAQSTKSADLPPAPSIKEGNDTTHFSILDKDGNAVAATMSINLPFGSAYMPEGLGFFLNDEMDDFAASSSDSNAYGLMGSGINLPAPKKRPLSSMSPTFVAGPNGLLIVGTPGGSRIPTMVLLAILGFTDGLDAKEIVKIPRFHHQYLPDEVQFEPAALSESVQEDLQGRGHVLKPLSEPYGNLNLILLHKRGWLEAAADPRAVGRAQTVRLPPMGNGVLIPFR